MKLNSGVTDGNQQLEQYLKQLEGSMGGPVTTGNVYFVIPTANSNYTAFVTRYQKTYEEGSVMIQSTLTAALAACVTNRGDTIYIAPGYTQSIIGAAGQTITKNGITIVGLGNGAKTPTFTWTTAVGASFDISGADVTLYNLKFVAGLDAITAMFNVTGADVFFNSCEFTTNTAALGVVLGILTAATAARLRVENCRFLGTAANSGTTTTAQIKHEVGVDYIIKNNYFTGKMTQAILNATAVLRGLIDGNRFVVATGTVAITMHASSTPFIVNNRINVPSGTAPIVAAAGFVSGNNYSAAAGVTAGTASTI